MRFEEQLLMDLKTEMTARNERSRRVGRRLLAGAAVAGLAAVAAVAMPLLTGPEPAYAVSENANGTSRWSSRSSGTPTSWSRTSRMWA